VTVPAADPVRARITELARLGPAPGPVVSVYLDTRWSDEQQRERVRVFVKNEAGRARDHPAVAEDLEWVQDQVERLVAQLEVPNYNRPYSLRRR
jgi:hypothetical protein